MSVESWKHHRAKKERDIVPSVEEVIASISSIENERDRFLIALMYLTGARVQEVLKVQKQDIQFNKINERMFLVLHVYNLKNKTTKWKNIPIPMDREKALTDIIIDWAEKHEGDLFGFKSSRRAEQITEKYGFNPHWYRHVRCTHLITFYRLDSRHTRKMMGWTDDRPARVYEHLQWEDIADRM